MKRSRNHLIWLWVDALFLVFLVFGCAKKQERAQEAVIYKIAAILPVSGPNAAQGIGMMNSCRVAIKDINESETMGAIKLELMELDDESKPEVAVRAAERAAQDPQILAVTGHWNSGCALATNPVFHKNGLVNLVPAAINSKITLEQPGDEIFRIDPHDLIIVQYAAEFAGKVKDWKNIFIIDDNTFYGKELARKFKDEYSKHGGTVLGQDAINVGEKDFASLLTRVKGKSPDLIFFGGLVTEAALIRRQMQSVGLDADFLSLTGIFTQSFIDVAGPTAEGVYSVTVVPPIDLLPGGRQFEESYEKGNFSHPYEAWGIYGYASIQVLAEAIRRVSPNPTRRAVINEMKAGEFETVLGKMKFDENGQTTLITMWVYEVVEKEWRPKYATNEVGLLKAFGK